MRKKDYVIFSGSTSKKLTKKMSGVLQLPLGTVEFCKFANSEFRLRVIDRVLNKICLVVQTTNRPVGNNLLELFFLIDTLKKSGAKRIVALIPYFGYSRQHTAFRSGECVSTLCILKLLRATGVDKVVTFDFHNVGSLKASPLPVANLSILTFLAQAVARKIIISNAMVVSPDEGGAVRAQVFSDCLFGKKGVPVTVIKKQRDHNKLHTVKHQKDFAQDGKLAGKTVILVDDICTTGKTLLSAITLCAKQGARSVYAVVVHADVDESVLSAIQNSPLMRMFTTNTIEKVENLARPFSKIEVVDIGEAAKLTRAFM